MIRILTALIILVSCYSLDAQEPKKNEPYIKIAEKVEAKAGRLVKLTVQTNGKMVKWFSA
jgi:hypothetical protein